MSRQFKSVTVTFDCSNAAFCDHEDGGRTEAGRILREAAQMVELLAVPHTCPLHDINGNRIGRLTVETEEAGDD